MRKQIRTASRVPSNSWLPGLAPLHDDDDVDEGIASFDVVAKMEVEFPITPPAAFSSASALPSPSTVLEPDNKCQQSTVLEVSLALAESSTENDGSILLGSVGELSLSSEPEACQVAPEPEGVVKRADFHIPASLEYPIGVTDRFNANCIAIETLRQIEELSSAPTEEQLTHLARYTGWGGLSEAFGGRKSYWDDRRERLSTLLRDDEYESARSSVLNAHYTEPAIIRWMYAAVEKMGFAGGRVLDPCTGIGHFLGAMPEHLLATASTTAVEPDSISSRIAALLYPSALFKATGLQNADLPDDHYDLVISNVPFGDYAVHDKALRGKSPLIHDYFFIKAMRLVRPGGLVAFITSTGTMDKVSKEVRKKLGGVSDLVCAFRLPKNAFQMSANTEVTTDVVFLRRRDSDSAPTAAWLETKQVELKYGQVATINEYFESHPDHIVGELSMATRGQYQTIEVQFDGNLGLELNDRLAKVPSNVYKPRVRKENKPSASAIRLDVAFKPNSFCIAKGVVMRVGPDRVTASPTSGIGEKTLARIAGMVRIRDAMKGVLRSQVEDHGAQDIAAAIGLLNRQYDEFVSTHGILHDRTNRRAFRGDPDLPSLLALEEYDDEAGTAKKMPIFERRTIIPSSAPSTVGSVDDAFLVSLNWKGSVDPEFIASLIPGRGWPEIARELMDKRLAWINPQSGSWESREVYLAGNVRKKLHAARHAALSDKSFDAHVNALNEIVPEDLSPTEISANLGAAWIPDDVVLDFAKFLLETEHLTLGHVRASATWKLSFSNSASLLVRNNVPNISMWGTQRVTGRELIADALNQVTTTVYDTMADDSTKVNSKETMLAREKVSEIRSKFVEWLWSDSERSARLVRLYNDEFNSVVLPKYDGSHLTFPGISDAIVPRGYQANGIWRYLCGGNLLVAHAVGAGKTAFAIIANMEAKRLGIFKKVMFVVPNHMLEDYAAEFLRIYPAANLLCASKEELTGDRRRELLARIATGDWDAIVITQASFEKLPLGNNYIDGFIDDELHRLDEAIAEAWADGDRAVAKRLESVRKSVHSKLEKLLDDSSKDGNISFEELGVDALVYDEAQALKNLFYSTKISRVAGLSNSVSRRALDAYSKILYIQSKHCFERGVMFTTATPIANSMAELFTVQRYLSRNLLREHDLDSFDAWAATFGKIVSSMEVSPDGGGFRMNSRFAQFVNLPELMQMFGAIADVKTREEIKLPVPLIQTGKPEVIIAKPSAELRAVVATLVGRAERIRSGAVRPDEDNMLAVTGDGRRAALDLRLLDPAAADDPGSKVNLAVENIFGIWHCTRNENLAQLVFCDLSTPKKDGFSVYQDMRTKFICRGIPEDEIAFIHDYDTDERKASLFRRVRKGLVRILIGSTAKMGVGTNVQRLLYAVHHLDSPWRPDEVEQRDGRILRPGNLNNVIRIFRYITESTFDAYMWQTLEAKARFIAQVMTPGCVVRSAEDVAIAALTYAEIKAIATGSPLHLKKAQIESEIAKLCIKKREHGIAIGRARRELELAEYSITRSKLLAQSTVTDCETIETSSSTTAIRIGASSYIDSKDANEAFHSVLRNAARMQIGAGEYHVVGRFKGFEIGLRNNFTNQPEFILKGTLEYKVNSATNICVAMSNTLGRIRELKQERLGEYENTVKRFADLRNESLREFSQQLILNDLYQEQARVLTDLGLTADQSYGAEATVE